MIGIKAAFSAESFFTLITFCLKITPFQAIKFLEFFQKSVMFHFL